MGALTLLNEQGDVTIFWEEESDEKLIPIIEKKMTEGMVFFIIEPRMGGLLPPEKKALTDPQDATKHRALSIRDEDLAQFVEAGHGKTAKTPAARVKTTRRAETAREVAASESVGVQPLKGG